MGKQRTKIELPNGDMLVLMVKDIEEDVDLDDLTLIDMSNIAAEIVTISPLMNKFGLLLADMDKKVALAKLNLEITESKIKQQIRNNSSANANIEEADDDDVVRKKIKVIPIKKLTNDEVDTKLVMNKVWQQLKRKLIETETERAQINSVYWAIKEKSNKLDKVSVGLTTGDVLEQLVNTKLSKINLVNLLTVKSRIK